MGMAGWRSIEKYVRGTRFDVPFESVTSWFGIPINWGALLVIVAALAMIWGRPGTGRAVRLLLALGVASLGLELGLGLVAGTSSVSLPIARVIGSSFLLIALLNRFFESEHEWDGSVARAAIENE